MQSIGVIPVQTVSTLWELLSHSIAGSELGLPTELLLRWIVALSSMDCIHYCYAECNDASRVEYLLSGYKEYFSITKAVACFYFGSDFFVEGEN